MHTETNLAQGPNGDEAVYWLWKQWANVLRLRNDGVPIVGFTWYSLTDQIDWDTALREQNGRVHPVGLYDLDRNIRPVGEAYKKLVADWREVLPDAEHLPARADRPPARVRRVVGPCSGGQRPEANRHHAPTEPAQTTGRR